MCVRIDIANCPANILINLPKGRTNNKAFGKEVVKCIDNFILYINVCINKTCPSLYIYLYLHLESTFWVENNNTSMIPHRTALKIFRFNCLDIYILLTVKKQYVKL
jgi:hypothetical protein